MIPLKDNVPVTGIPFITLALIVINGYFFYLELTLPDPALIKLIGEYGLVPLRFVKDFASLNIGIATFEPLLTNIFLHGGWMHIIGNMWYLWIFGGSLEYCLGHSRFLLFYIACGLIANLTQIIVDPASSIPVIGASGAISGVLGAYAICFPGAKIKTLIPIIIIFTIVEIPALLFLGLWFFLQLLNGASALSMAGAGIAWWAHIGGFVAGVAMNRFLVKR